MIAPFSKLIRNSLEKKAEPEKSNAAASEKPPRRHVAQILMPRPLVLTAVRPPVAGNARKNKL